MAPILGTVSSGYVEPSYQLAQTFNSSGTYTVSAGVTKIAVVAIGGGGNGNAGARGNNTSKGAGGNGGVASRTVGFYDYAVNSGQTFSVTIGGSGGGTTSFGTNISNVSPTLLMAQLMLTGFLEEVQETVELAEVMVME